MHVTHGSGFWPPSRPRVGDVSRPCVGDASRPACGDAGHSSGRCRALWVHVSRPSRRCMVISLALLRLLPGPLGTCITAFWAMHGNFSGPPWSVSGPLGTCITACGRCMVISPALLRTLSGPLGTCITAFQAMHGNFSGFHQVVAGPSGYMYHGLLGDAW